MRTFTFFLIMTVLLMSSPVFVISQVGINNDNSAPDDKAMLDIKSTEKGLLIPRMTTVQRTAITSPPDGLQVYDTDTHSLWFFIAEEPFPHWTEITGGGTGWLTTGNAGTDPSVNFIGTTDYQSLIFKVADERSGWIDVTSTTNTGFGYKSLLVNTTGWSNSAFGFNALLSNLTGHENSAFGAHALYDNMVGVGNSVFGCNAFLFNHGGSGNTGVGCGAGQNSEGSNNVFIGYNAGFSGGSSNIAIGYNADYYNTYGMNNTIIGFEAGKGSASHNKFGNIFIGYQAGLNETGSNKLYIENTSSSSPLIGGDFSSDQVYINGKLGIGTMIPAASSILDLTSTDKGLLLPRMTTTQRTAISVPVDGLMVYDTDTDAIYIYRNGAWSPSLTGATGWTLTGNNGTDPATNFLGTTDNQSLVFKVNNKRSGWMDVKDANCGFGYQSLLSTTGIENSAFGTNALYSNGTGSNNTVVGFSAGYLSTGDGNVYIGHQAGYSETGSNKLYIANDKTSEPLIYGDFSTGKATINSVLKLAPMSSAPSSPTEGELYVNSTDHHIYCYLNGGWKQLD